MWRALTLHDHWQGEACAAGIAAMVWSLIGFCAPEGAIDMHPFKVLAGIAPELFFQVWLAVFGILQLYGLRYNRSYARAAGALGVFSAFSCVFYSLFLANPWTLGLALYANVMMVEFLAVVYQTAQIIRYQEGPAWLWTNTNR